MLCNYHVVSRFIDGFCVIDNEKESELKNRDYRYHSSSLDLGYKTDNAIFKSFSI